jgi:hypothetical protein
MPQGVVPARPPFVDLRLSPEQSQFEAEIKSRLTEDEVLELLAPRWGELHEVHVSTALHTLSRLAGRRASWLRDDARFAQLMATAQALFDVMTARELSSILYSCLQLGVTPSADWLAHYWRASGAVMDSYAKVPKWMSNSLYVTGLLGVMPPEEWLAELFLVSGRALPRFNSRDFANSLYGCSKLGVVPPQQWLEMYWRQSGDKLYEANQQDLCVTMQSCADLRIMPCVPLLWLSRPACAC